MAVLGFLFMLSFLTVVNEQHASCNEQSVQLAIPVLVVTGFPSPETGILKEPERFEDTGQAQEFDINSRIVAALATIQESNQARNYTETSVDRRPTVTQRLDCQERSS